MLTASPEVKVGGSIVFLCGEQGEIDLEDFAAAAGRRGPLDYDEVRRLTSRWAPYGGLVYFHLLLDRIDEAGWLTG